MRFVLVALVVLSLAIPVFSATQVKVGDPIESVYAGLVKIDGSDSTDAAQDICGPDVAAVTLHKSFYGPPGSSLSSATAGEFDVVGAAHPFVAATYPPDGNDPLAVYVADSNGKIKEIDDPEQAPGFCLLVPQIQ